MVETLFGCLFSIVFCLIDDCLLVGCMCYLLVACVVIVLVINSVV